IALTEDLLPATINGSGKMSVSRAEGAFDDLANFSGSLEADLTPKEIKQIALRFARGGEQLGQVRLSGPLDIERQEGTLKLEVHSIDENVLELATAGTGYDLGNTAINSTNQI